MSSAREQALKAVRPRDVIFGIAAGGQEKLLLVYETDESKIFARHVTSQTRVEFGRDGQSLWCQGGGSCSIVSTAALSPEDHAIVIGLDRKMRTGKDYPDFVLSKEEIQLLLEHDKFFKAHLLPEV